ncbi:MAG: FHA domain-containing protein [Clostridia bacterium]|nr:FHA domain-containing protein [Clostridia bacterium]
MQFITAVSRFILPVITLIILIKCILSLWLGHPKEKTYGYIIDMINGERYALNMWETSIGRGSSCDITLSYDNVARTHAVFTRRIDGWYIHNINYVKWKKLAELEGRLSRSNRKNTSSIIKINGTRVEDKATVSDGDIITLGNVRLRFEVADDPVQKVGKKKKKSASAPSPVKHDYPQYDIDRHYEEVGSYTVETPGKQSTKKKSSQPRIINKDTGEAFILCGNEVTIGKGRCDIKLSSRHAAKKHALLILYEDGWAVSDCSGKKGTYLNGKLITSPQLLFSGDVIAIGDERLFYEGGRR